MLHSPSNPQEAEGELARLTAATEEMDAMEARFWHDYSDFQLQLLRYGEDRDALLARIAGAVEQREELRKANVFNDAFHIWHDGPFGTINGLRLGRTGGARGLRTCKNTAQSVSHYALRCRNPPVATGS